MTTVLHEALERMLADEASKLGCPSVSVRLTPCPKSAMGDAATSAALQAARILKRSPMDIAAQLAALMEGKPGIAGVGVAAPGYVNFTFSADAVASALTGQAADPHVGIAQVPSERIVIDFGGPNIKPMHVGHMRSLFIGECLRRMLATVGHDVVSDIHLGDWGLPSGMILSEIALRNPASGWFADGEILLPDVLPLAPGELAGLYPAAAAACKDDPERMVSARACTAALQAGEPGLSALWKMIVASAKVEILATCSRLGAHFDLTLGESDAQPEIPAMLASLEASGAAVRDGTALLMIVRDDGDKQEVPPLVLEKGDGSALYATTDMATVVSRVRDMHAERIVYVVDNRQALHFLQVFRASSAAGISRGVVLEHIGFGTVNGTDGKPFRTRAGGTMRLEDLLDMATEKARERLVSGARLEGASEMEVAGAAEAIGIAALRVADLGGHRLSGYVLDIDRALSFEGRTGPHLLYALVRLRAILAKAAGAGGPLVLGSEPERRLALACLGLGAAVHRALEERTPHELVNWAFDLASDIGRFYLDCPVSGEENPTVRASRISLCMEAERVLGKAIELIGCRVPAAM